jgi:hypothetical protein
VRFVGGQATRWRERPSNDDSLPRGFSNQAWYLLASMWGAMFTYIVAPLAVEYLRRRMKSGRRLRAHNNRLPTSPSVEKLSSPPQQLHSIPLLPNASKANRESPGNVSVASDPSGRRI